VDESFIGARKARKGYRVDCARREKEIEAISVSLYFASGGPWEAKDGGTHLVIPDSGDIVPDLLQEFPRHMTFHTTSISIYKSISIDCITGVHE
jgi:hypothetical protein